MHKKSKNLHSHNEAYENKLIIEKWMKRNSSKQVTDEQNTIKLDDTNKNGTQISNANDNSTKKIKFTVTKTKLQKITNDQEAKSDSISIKKSINKHSKDPLSNQIKCNILKRKVDKHSTNSNELRLTNKFNDTNVISRKTVPDIEDKLIAPKISKNSNNLKWMKNSADSMKVDKKMNGKLPSTMQCDELSSIAQDNKTAENDTYNKSSIKYLLCKETDADVYTSLLENYRYLITPKSWSVIEFTSETKDRFIVFFNVHVIKENDTLISVMRKSLIIGKGAAINYSVHGLPVDIKGTILPKTLDNTKKLLSILHIFDKMQVCDGLGSDLNIMQTDFVFKDNCRYWRHKHCKVILVKAMRCLICTETRSLLLERNVILKKDTNDDINSSTAK